MIKVYMHYLKLKDFRHFEPVVIRTSFSSQDDIETYVMLKDVYLKKLQNGILIKRKHWYEKLMFWKKSI